MTREVIHTIMLFERKYNQCFNDAVDIKRTICENQEQAIKYYSQLFKDDYPPKTVKGEKLNLYTNSTYNLELEQYLFYDFDTVDIGKPVALSESDYLIVEGCRINYSTFQNCNIKNIVFRRCSFSGSTFTNVHFDHVVFDSCLFSVPVIENGRTGVDDIYYAPTIFRNCTVVGRISDCSIEHTLFEKVCFTLTKFERSSLQECVFDMCPLSSVEVKDCNLSDFKVMNTDILEITFSDELKSIVNENTFIDYKVKIKKGGNIKQITTDSGWKIDNYDDAILKKSKTVKSISMVFDSNNMRSISGEYFYQSKLIEYKALHKSSKLFSTVGLVSCGYGERPSFTLISIAVTTLLFAVIYMFAGINANGITIDYTLTGGYPIGIVKAISDYGECLYFSIITGTIGYGNYDPIGLFSKIVSSLHMILGIGLFALWTGCIFKKFER
ncbi:pentapeptide repeat-containing protein [Ruminococcaceae bacterium OttesenSCG-928-L11]|nr:pentapeptide repeat-containing protein [Ruminococcaceae bacterium OttesenSCG-928-L11]